MHYMPTYELLTPERCGITDKYIQQAIGPIHGHCASCEDLAVAVGGQTDRTDCLTLFCACACRAGNKVIL